MSSRVKTIDVFERQTKRLIQKYPSLRHELLALVQRLKDNPFQGTALGKSCYKIRLSIAEKGKGKSGGARGITHFVSLENSVFLLSIYDKADQGKMADKELEELLKDVHE